MLIKEKKGNLKLMDPGSREVDLLKLEWYETSKRILHKKTESGKDITIKFLNESQLLQQDDVIFEDEEMLIVIDILRCDVIVIKPAGMFEMAHICYEIGNKHLPLFYDSDELLIPYEAPIWRMLQAAGFSIAVEHRRLQNQLRTSVSAHMHTSNSATLFSKILQLTTRPSDAK